MSQTSITEILNYLMLHIHVVMSVWGHGKHKHVGIEATSNYQLLFDVIKSFS